jgi:hypothetical protein
MKNKCSGNCKQRVHTGIKAKYLRIVLRSDLILRGVEPCHYGGQSIKRVNENECNFPVKCHHSIKSIKGLTSCTVIEKELRKYYESLKILVRTQIAPWTAIWSWRFRSKLSSPITKRYTFLNKRKTKGDKFYFLILSFSLLISVTTYLKQGKEEKEVASVLTLENCRN